MNRYRVDTAGNAHHALLLIGRDLVYRHITRAEAEELEAGVFALFPGLKSTVGPLAERIPPSRVEDRQQQQREPERDKPRRDPIID